jgi:anoctamin-4
MNLAIILGLGRVYRKIAIWLTNFENPRTQTEFEDSYAFKIFVLQFNNFYGSLIYIAFFKGKFFTQPGEGGFLNLRTDVCDPSGCLIEVCIQLVIIMVGKQSINNFREYFIP